ncbi:NUDIX domain-containing protein [Aeromicrobium sp.]|uniref:NUDIX hydrolase n=1 Tax=Aeromicrobium sp. TaxID=1871063 RepID=UPI00199501A0|nr:NUDIX domain-containing protein [Aeromicrobium sp.]MBC7631605.1 NUDIX hydrolase [Aeromicrobium sp.]
MTKRQKPPKYSWAYVAVDIVVLTVRDRRLQVMAIRRGRKPGLGGLALPGGFVHLDEDLETAARRELREETGLEVDFLEQVKTYGAPDRDPRNRTFGVLYLAVMPNLPEGAAGTDADDAQWIPVDELLATDLPFDHHDMLVDALERARAKLEYSPIAASFCRPTFTIGQLRQVYEIIWGVGLDPANFSRKTRSVDDFLVETGDTVSEGPGRPARTYTVGSATVLNPPINR